MREEINLPDEFGEVRVRRLPSPGIAAVLAVLVPGFLLHAINIWSAYRAAEEAGG